MTRRAVRNISGIAISLLMSFSALAQDVPQDVNPDKLDDIQKQTEAQKQIETELKAKRDDVLADISGLKSNINQMSGELASLSQESNALGVELEALQKQKLAAELDMSRDKETMTGILAALQRIESNPPPSVAVQPNDAANAVRAGLLMSNLNDQLNVRVSDLRTSLEALEVLRDEIAIKQNLLMRSQERLEGQQKALKAQISQKNELERSISADYGAAQARREALAAEAQNLQELINRLEYSSRDIIPRIKPDPNAPAAETAPPSRSRSTRPVNIAAGEIRFSSSKGRLYTPVTGKLTKKYSGAHPGLTIETAGQAEVFAPAAGRVDFAGAFKNYGNVAIINVDDGYFVLLTGLGQLNVQGGSDVSAGDSVGLMPVNSSSNEKLYIEVRKNGSTLDPVPWFGTTFAQR